MSTDILEIVTMTPDEEENAVRQLGQLIGYGRTMQLCEKLWSEMSLVPKGGHLTIGVAAGLLVSCPHPENGRDANGHCDWCCGSGRVTKRVFQAMQV